MSPPETNIRLFPSRRTTYTIQKSYPTTVAQYKRTANFVYGEQGIERINEVGSSQVTEAAVLRIRDILVRIGIQIRGQGRTQGGCTGCTCIPPCASPTPRPCASPHQPERLVMRKDEAVGNKKKMQVCLPKHNYKLDNNLLTVDLSIGLWIRIV
jgi:hypothetical protein